MIIDRVGAVGVVLTESNEPVLTGGDQIIGFRSLEYEIYRGAFPVKKGLVDARTGWVWQTRRRLLLFDNAWVDLADGRKGKHYHEIRNEEALDVIHKKGRVLVPAESEEFGKVTFEFRPFGAASRLLAWLKNEKAVRRMRDEGTLKSPYDGKDRDAVERPRTR
ncbi:MAG TPA: hypothetical protein VJ326_02470 [Thermoplasmata archaeon]|nr:hypothetical protein [Thermoplasmata archaeon]